MKFFLHIQYNFVWLLCLGLLMVGCKQAVREEAIRQYLSEVGYFPQLEGEKDTLILVPLKTCTSCMLEYRDLIAGHPDHFFIISTPNPKKARILFPDSAFPNVLFDGQNRAVDEFDWVTDFPRLLILSKASYRVEIGENLHATELGNILAGSSSGQAPKRFPATFRALDTLSLNFSEPRYNLGGLKKDGSFLFFMSRRFFPELNQHGSELTILHLLSGQVATIGRKDLGERAPVEGIQTFARIEDRLYLLGTTHLFEFSLVDQSLSNQIRPLFEGDLALARTSDFFRRIHDSGEWLCPVGLWNVHSSSPAFFSADRGIIAVLDQNGTMGNEVGQFPEAFRKGFFLHPPSLFVADLFQDELHLLINSQKELEVYDLQGKKRRTLMLPISEWLSYNLNYLEVEYESDQAMLDLSQDPETLAANANEYFQGVKVGPEGIRIVGTGIRDTGTLRHVPHHFVLDYYTGRNI